MKKSEIVSFFADNVRLKKMYQELIPMFKTLVKNNSGTEAEAEDLLQDSIVLCYKKTQEDNFLLTSKLETFIYGIGRRKWMQQLRKKVNHTEIMTTSAEGNLIDEIIINDEKNDLYLKHFNLLSESCQRVLTFFFEGLKMFEIADKMNFSSEGYARKRKHNCQTNLLDSIKKDALFTELTADGK